MLSSALARTNTDQICVAGQKTCHIGVGLIRLVRQVGIAASQDDGGWNLVKHRQVMKRFELSAEASVKEGHPAVFKEVSLVYALEGEIEPAKLIETVELSQTKYCSVSAMIARAAPIHYW